VRLEVVVVQFGGGGGKEGLELALGAHTLCVKDT
jgi:hypothetical protein